jgi:hypothetical protein
VNTKPALVFCALLFLPLAPLVSQVPGTVENVFSHPLNAENRRGFDRVCAALSGHRVIRGNFTQTKTFFRAGRSLVSRGLFAVDAARGMIWDTREPFPSVMAVGRDFIVQTGGGRKNRVDAAGNETFIRISGTMSAVFTGNEAKLLEGFDVCFTEGGGSWTMGLVPRDGATKAFARSIVLSGDADLREVSLLEQNGNSVRYELSAHSYGAALSAAEAGYFEM